MTCMMAKRAQVATATAIYAAVLLTISPGIVADLRHHSQYGDWMSYGWHFDVISQVAEGGIVVPGVQHTQRAVVTNFTILPHFVEACIAPNVGSGPHEIPIFPFRIERLAKTGTWQTWPPSQWPTCLNLPIRRKIIWPLKSYSSQQGALAAVTWFHKGDWIRFVGLSKCDKPTEPHEEFVSQPFQLTGERIGKEGKPL